MEFLVICFLVSLWCFGAETAIAAQPLAETQGHQSGGGQSPARAANTPTAGTPALNTPALNTPALNTPALNTPASGSSCNSNADSFRVLSKAASRKQLEAARLQDEGLLLLRANANEEALEKFKQALSVYDGFAELHHSLAIAFAKSGDDESAVAELKKAIALNESFPDSWILLAGVYQASGRIEEAIDSYQEFVKRFPKDPSIAKVNTSLAILYARLGQNEAAIHKLKAALSGDSRLSSGWVTLGGVYQASGNLEAAISIYEEFLARFPDDPMAARIKSLNQTLRKERDEKQKKQAQDRVIADPVVELTEELRKGPGNAELLFQLAKAYELKGLWESALAQCRRFSNEFPDDLRLKDVESLSRKCLAEIKKEKSALGTAAGDESVAASPDSSTLSAGSGSSTINSGRANKLKSNDDYLGRISWTRWPRSRIPITVYLADGTECRGFRPALKAILKLSFEDWSKASKGSVTFTFVDSPDAARLRCFWTDKAASLNWSEAGEAKLWEDQSYIARAEIRFLTQTLGKSTPVSDNLFRAVSLHEIGHALGLKDHSDRAEDIMFYSTSFAESWRELSGRDSRTVERLYKNDL